VTFSVDDSSVATVGALDGVVTLTANSVFNVFLSIRSSDAASASTSVQFACNLDPIEGDVDVGLIDGTALPSASVGSTISVPIRVNIGSYDLRSIQLHVLYDAS
jgi:hypothetical protein